MRIDLRACLDLVRLPNVFTAAADILAGYLYVGGGIDGWPALLQLVAASACLYGGGVALNDVCDIERDRHERPSRPIPSGRVSIPCARIVAVVLLVLGLFLAATVSVRAAIVAALLVASIVLYDGIVKDTLIAPALMGLCRALNLALAMTPIAAPWTAAVAVPLLLMWMYVTSVTYFARFEAKVSSRPRLGVGTVGICAAAAGQVSLCWLVAGVHIEFLLLVVGLVAWLGFQGSIAQRDDNASAGPGSVAGPRLEARADLAIQGCRVTEHDRTDPATLQRVVKNFLLALVVFDASLAWAARGPFAALVVMVMLPPAILLARRLRMT